MKKLIFLALGAIAVVGLYIKAAKSGDKGGGNKPEPEGYSPSGQGSTTAEPDWGSPFDMNYAEDVVRWLAPKKVVRLHPARAAQLAEKLYQAKGESWFDDDDEAAVEEVFEKFLLDGVQVADVARKFNWLYQKDLWEHLRGFLNGSELEEYVSLPVRSLPPYRLSNS